MPISLAQQIDRVARDHAALARFARRRESFLAALDWRHLDPALVQAAERGEERINEELAEGWLLLLHLEERRCASGG